VCDQPNVHVAASALSALTGSGAVLLAERLPADREWGGLRGVPIHRDSSPVIDIEEGGWDGYLNGRSANFRQQIRRRSRRLERGLGVTFRLTDSPDHLERDLDALVKLHAARWGAKSTALEAPKEAFHRAFAARALERGRLRLWVAEAEGTPVAVWYGFRFASVEYYYQSGRDPAWDRFSLGAGILEHSIREACADGMREYRLLRGDEAYKSRYATRDPGLVTIAAARRPLGRTVVAVTARLATSKTGLRLLKPFA
jgi:CelD/BcsL family acetyltransferase involved in cellulose biosynthesis